MAPVPDRILLGDIGRAQGLKGEVRIRSFTQDPGAIASYGPLEVEDGTRLVEFEKLRIDGNGLVARIKGVATREAAEALNGTKLFIGRERLPAHGEDEWYHADLIGLSVRDKDGAPFGTVVAVHNFGASDILEIKPLSGEADLLVTFTDEAVPEINVTEGWLKLVPPEEHVVPPSELE